MLESCLALQDLLSKGVNKEDQVLLLPSIPKINDPKVDDADRIAVIHYKRARPLRTTLLLNSASNVDQFL